MTEEEKLVFKKTEKKTDFTQLNKLIYGLPKSGKSTLASKMIIGDRAPLFISTEDGLGNLEVFAQRVENWEMFLKVRDYIIAKKDLMKKTHSNIIIDLVSDLNDMATAFVCNKFKVPSLSDLAYGKGFALQAEEFKAGINPLFNVLPLTFITHCKEKEFNYNGEKIKIQSPTLQEKAFDFINGKVDMIGFIIPANSKKDHPTLTMRPSTIAVAGCRFPFMCTEFDLDFNNMQLSYDKINECFTNGGETINNK